MIAAGYVAITVARVLVVYGLIGGGSRLVRREAPLPVGYLHVMFWAGLRGAVAVALALALPLSLPDREPADGRRVRGRADHAAWSGHDGRLGDPARRGDLRDAWADPVALTANAFRAAGSGSRLRADHVAADLAHVRADGGR